VSDLTLTESSVKPPSGALGGKAASLVQLSEWGLPVPEFTVIAAPALRECLRAGGLQHLDAWLDRPWEPLPCPAESIRGLLQELPLPLEITRQVAAFVARFPEAHFAVRSSANLEDGADASFAGLFTSVLNVRDVQDVASAIRTCWSAAFDARVATYMRDKCRGASLDLALVVQRLVPARSSGVLFTVNPLRGVDTEMLVEACFGLGEALVSGQVTPDQYSFDWRADAETERVVARKSHWSVRLPEASFVALQSLPPQLQQAPVLTTDQVRELVSLGTRIQARTGRPVDIEWAWVDGRFHVLQSRPITRLAFAGIEGEWTTADLRDGGVSSSVCTPFMASLYGAVMNTTMPAYLQRLGFRLRSQDREWMRVYYSRPYWNLGATKFYLAKIPGFKERTFDEGLGIVPSYTGDGLVARTTPATLYTGLRALLAIKRSCRRQLAQCPAFAAEQKQRLAQLRKLDMSTLDDAELFRFCGTFLRREYFRSEAGYFNHIYDNANLNGLFLQKIAGLKFPKSEIPLLFSGLDDVSHMAPIGALWRLREQLQAGEDMDFWLQQDAGLIAGLYQAGDRSRGLDLLAAYLEAFGHHAQRELDLKTPRYAEDPLPVVRQIQEVLRQPESLDPRPRNRQQQTQAAAAAERLLAAAPFWRRPGLRRELAQVRRFLWWREELRDLSTRFYQQVRRLVLAVEQRLLARGVLQADGDVFFLPQEDLLALIEGALPAQQARERVSANRLYYDAFAKFVIPDEIGTRYGGETPAATADGGYKGVAGSPGVATGTARVIADIQESERLQPGDILVTRCTDPGWTPKFSMLSGVVTETGGILSHAAVICREYGIPAILAVTQATQRIRDGQTITIDGNNGRIFVQED
jgi:phosphohistidine swiveling domain-containing protein